MDSGSGKTALCAAGESFGGQLGGVVKNQVGEVLEVAGAGEIEGVCEFSPRPAAGPKQFGDNAVEAGG